MLIKHDLIKNTMLKSDGYKAHLANDYNLK